MGGVICLQCLGAGQLQQLADERFALPGRFFQPSHNVRPEKPNLFQPLDLPQGGVRDLPHLGQPPGDVCQNVLLHLLPQRTGCIRNVRQIIRRQHQTSPKDSTSLLCPSSAASWTAALASSSLMPRHSML